MLTVLWFLKRWPKQIESDLSRIPGGRKKLRQWHRGTRDRRGRLKISSRELLVILEYLPDDGALKMAQAGREGDWPEWVEVLAKIQEDAALYHAFKYGKDQAQVILSPKARWQAYQEAAEEEQDAESAMDEVDSWFE